MMKVEEKRYQMFAANLTMLQPLLVEPETLLASKTVPSPARVIVNVMVRWGVDYWSDLETESLKKVMETLARVMMRFNAVEFVEALAKGVEAALPAGRYFIVQVGNNVIEHKVEEIGE